MKLFRCGVSEELKISKASQSSWPPQVRDSLLAKTSLWMEDLVSGDFIVTLDSTRTLVRLISEKIHFFCTIQLTPGKRNEVDLYGN